MTKCEECIHINVCRKMTKWTPKSKDCSDYCEKPKKGEWKDITPNHYFTCGGEPLVICPFCGDQESKHVQGIENHMWNFCPNCGADMREADKEVTNG